MAENFLPGAGSVIESYKKGTSMYKVEGLEPKYESCGMLTVDSIKIGSSDIGAPIVALDDHKAIYKFGSNFARVEIQGKVYIGPDGKSSALDTLESFFQSNRLSKKTTPVKVSIASSAAYFAYLLNLEYSQPDLDFGMIAYSITGIVLDNPSPGK